MLFLFKEWERKEWEKSLTDYDGSEEEVSEDDEDDEDEDLLAATHKLPSAPPSGLTDREKKDYTKRLERTYLASTAVSTSLHLDIWT